MANQQWLESPPGLSKMKPLKRSKVQQEATELLSTSWASLPEETQTKLQAFGIGPSKPEEPELKDLLKTHMDALPQQVQQTVSKLTAPGFCTEREIAAKLKGQVTKLKNMSIRKNQLQVKIDGAKAQYAPLLTDMHELQSKLAEGQKALHQLSEDYMKAVNQTPLLQELWKQHDLNIQKDASHFVNSLWLLSQSRAFHCRFAETKEGGYLTDHVQQPILVAYPDD